MADEQGKTYELKHKETSFYDDQTGLTVTRDQRVKIGEDAGRRTLQMIRTGGLIEVNHEPKPPAGTAPTSTDAGDVLSDDFPGKAKLEAAGYRTLASVVALTPEQLKKIPGLSASEESAILKAAAKATKQ
ncbi:MAG TPA: hypothetical protein VGV38_03545 [Pyrinomonadaceae bacterium]|nr:hypothetical protein [Pyrinomonadaceae bacterium]